MAEFSSAELGGTTSHPITENTSAPPPLEKKSTIEVFCGFPNAQFSRLHIFSFYGSFEWRVSSTVAGNQVSESSRTRCVLPGGLSGCSATQVPRLLLAKTSSSNKLNLQLTELEYPELGENYSSVLLCFNPTTRGVPGNSRTAPVRHSVEEGMGKKHCQRHYGPRR